MKDIKYKVSFSIFFYGPVIRITERHEQKLYVFFSPQFRGVPTSGTLFL